jgi:hypothetical protein
MCPFYLFFFFLVLSTLNDFALEIEHQSMSFCAANNVVEFVFNSFFFKVILKLFFHNGFALKI